MDARQFLQVIEHDAATWSLPVRVDLAGGRGQLFGGVALGAAVTQLEDLTGRPVVWATGQYISNAFPPDVVRFDAEVVVEGHNLTQARVIGHVDGREVLTVQAALGRRDQRGLNSRTLLLLWRVRWPKVTAQRLIVRTRLP